ncbi:MAG: FAD-dependent oxidoreductase [Thermodesulfobacteriota bacterium]
MGGEPVAVLGAGPAGLAAAYELVQRGVAPLVLEKGAAVGGIARTEVHRGYGFDVGGHRFFTKNEGIERLWHQVLGEDFLRVPRLSRIYYNGRFFRYPLVISNTLANLGPLESLLILASYVRARIAPSPREESFEEWVANRFGRRLYETFFRTYTEKVWGIPCTRIRADWAAQRIKGLSLATAVAKALLGAGKAKSLIDAFDYPRRGPGMMWERFRERIEAGGGRVCLGTEVTGLVCGDGHDGRNGRVTAVRVREGGQARELPVSRVISTLPLQKLPGLLEPAPPSQVVEAAARLSHRSFLMVGLILDRAGLFPDQWIYVHSPEVQVGRIQNFGNWSPEMVPEPGRAGVGMEYFCNEGDELWCRPDAELGALAARELERLGLARASEVVDHVVVRQPDAYPVYDQDYQEHLAVVRSHLAGFENLQTAGRSGMHRYNNMDHSMLTGILAAQNALGARHDVWDVNEEDEYLEEQGTAKGGRLYEAVLQRALARLDKVAFGAAVGTAAGLGLFLATLWLVVKGGPVVGPKLGLLAQYFPGYRVTWGGAFVGLWYGCTVGFAFGWVFAWLRNFSLALYVYRVRRREESVSLRNILDRV